jgi:DNA-binding NtrC family response regulator
MVVEDGEVVVRDLDSRNGTLVNGRPVRECPLMIGDEVCVGEVSLMLTGEGFAPSVMLSAQAAGNTLPIQRSGEKSGAESCLVEGLVDNGADLARQVTLIRACGAATSQGEIFQLAQVDIAARISPERFWLALHNPRTGECDVVAWWSSTAEDTRGTFPQAEAARVLAEGLPAAVPRNGVGGAPQSPVCLLLAPLRLADRSLGVIAVERTQRLGGPLEVDLDYLAATGCTLAPFIVAQEDRRQLEAQVARCRSELDAAAEFVGSSAKIEKMLYLAQLVARSEQAILVTGETGTGKELVARYIHSHSGRSFGPYVAINCAAIPPELFESEVFGHEKGAFTGASARKTGFMEQSNGGTLFLDEIGDLSLTHQARILRAVESGILRRVGGEKDIKTDFRIVAATNKALDEEVKAGRFREDLYHRLRGFELRIPPLRERREDIPELAQHFLERAKREANRPLTGFTPEALAYLTQCEWRGNVRELRQCINTAVIFAEGPLVDRDALEVYGTVPVAEHYDAPDGSLAEVEAHHIRRVMEQCEGNVLRASKKLGIARSTLYEKLDSYGIARK